MKILFVSSGNSVLGISPIVRNQLQSLVNAGCIVDHFLIKGKGYKGYLSNVKPLKKKIIEGQYDIVHAHYSLSAYVAGLAGAKPLVVSLMGSDVKGSRSGRIFLKFVSRIFNWRALIVKSHDLQKSLGKINSTYVLPNGVDTTQFIPMNRLQCCNKLRWEINLVNILFAASPERQEKNFALTLEAVTRLNASDVMLHVLGDIPHGELVYWYNAADVVLLSSLWEGSPNVIKEAMACNRPILATEVGDIRWLFGNQPGHYISGLSSEEFAGKLRLAIDFSREHGFTNGRQKLINLGLDASKVAVKILEIYKISLKTNNADYHQSG